MFCVSVPCSTHVEWARAFHKAITELQAYVKVHHTTGLCWNPEVCLCTYNCEVPIHTLGECWTLLASKREIHLCNSVSPRIKKKGGGGGGGGGGGIEHLYAWAHTLLAYTTILCCVKLDAVPPFPPCMG